MSTVYILWLRQIKKYVRSRARLVGALGQPLLFLLALGFGFGPIYRKAGGGNYIQFLAPGIISMGIMFTGIFSGIEVIWDREFGFLKETLVAPVSRVHVMIGRTMGGATVATLQGLIILLISLGVGFRPAGVGLVLLALVHMVLIAVLFTALGTAIASVLEDMQGFQLIINFLVMPIFFFSGALFPLRGLPESIQVVSSINPLTYGVDGLRGALIREVHFTQSLDLAVPAAVALLLLGIGSWLFSRIEI